MADNDRVLGLPHDRKFSNRDSLKAYVLKPLFEIGVPVLNKAKNEWEESGAGENCFSFEYEGEKWWGLLSDYELGNNHLHIGLIATESDFFGRTTSAATV